ncbi:MAG: chemotaxis protein CheX [Nitrospirae bacterium]|nr:chemotaxis protein CheX [Nitrospirota bacterium]
MRYEYIEPFVNSMVKVFDFVLQSDIAKGNMSLISSDRIEGDFAIVIRLRGDSEGSIILNMDEDTALKLCCTVNGECLESVTSLGLDSISEIANMIAGNATSTLNDMGFDFHVYPPEVMTRYDVRKKTPLMETFQVPLFTECGEITMNIALRTN